MRLSRSPAVNFANLMRCPKCNVPLVKGQAIQQTYSAGTPDFPGETRGMTMSPGGPGKLIDCLKCPDCGWSTTSTHIQGHAGFPCPECDH